MKKTIHLHIGTHKTGTTVLQQTLAENTTALAQQGYLYPRAGWHQYAQHFLAFEKKGSVNTGMESKTDRVWSSLHEEIERFDGNNVIVSSEEFSTLLEPEKILAIRNELQAYTVKVYVYLRRQDEIFESIYNQQTKDWLSPRTESIEECLASPEKIYPVFNYHDLLTRWAQIFGKENIIVSNYSQLRQQKLSTVDDFLALAGINTQTITPPANPTENKSVSRRAMELIRLSKLANLSEEKRQRIFELAIAYFPEHDSSLLTHAQRLRFIKNYKKTNKKLREFGIKFDDNTKQSPPPGRELTTMDIVTVLAHNL